MGAIDFLFGLFSLLLGLAMAEVLGGFAKVLKLHARARAGHERDVRVGWLVPLLAVFILLAQLSCWTIMFRVRDQLPFNYVALVVMTLVVGGHYLLASLVWPEELDEWADFDAYYDQHNRFILTGLLILTVIGAVIGAHYAPPAGTTPELSDDPVTVTVALTGVYGALALNIALIFVRRRRLNAALLTTLIVLELAGSVAMAVVLG